MNASLALNNRLKTGCSLIALLVFLLLLLFMPAVRGADSPASSPVTRPLTLRVVDAESNAPLEDVRVVVRNNGHYNDEGVRTNADGVARIDIERVTQYVSILFRKDGYIPTAVSWDDPDAPVSVPDSYTLKLPKGVSIGGTVLNEQDQPVAGASVILEYFPSVPNGSATVVARIRDETIQTDDQGRWTWNAVSPDFIDALQIRVIHPDYINDGGVARPPSAQLLDGSSKIVLSRGVDVAGRVVDAAGKPVAGARVTTVRFHYVSNDYGQTVSTDADGRFVIAHQRPRLMPITVFAGGHAPELVRINVTEGMPELNVTLQPARTLRGQVVDPDGKLLAGVYLMAQEWRGVSSISWSGTTDADGYFEMPDAPADAIQFQISKEGYRHIPREALTAGDQPVRVVMQPEMTARGRVTDAETGQPIAEFRVIPGFALWEARPPTFSFSSPRTFKDGAFEMQLDSHSETVGSYIRIEADGYRAAHSAKLEGDATVDIKLRRADPVAGTVTNPNGTPAANMPVALALPGDNVMLVGDKIPRSAQTLRAQTDGKGHFEFPAQATDYKIIVVSEAGYAIAPCRMEQEIVDVALAPWASLAGTYAPYGQPVVKQKLFFAISEARDQRDPSASVSWQTSISTDELGRFKVERVPHFGGATSSFQIGRSDHNGIDERRWMPLRLEPGQTTEVNVLGKQRLVRGCALPRSQEDALPGAQGWILLTRRSDISVDQWPADIMQAMNLQEVVYRNHIEPDGAFAVPDVPPGTYAYSVTIYGGSEWRSASGTFVLPAASNEAAALEPFDLGDIAYGRAAKIVVGQRAPENLGETFDQKPVRLDDFKGKFLVVALWDSCTGRSDAHLPAMNAAGEALAGDDGVALLSINADPVSCGTVGVPKRPATLDHPKWTRAFIWLAENSLLSDVASKKTTAIFIVDPAGKAVASEIDAAEIVQRVRELKNAR